MTKNSQVVIQELLLSIGIEINGKNPWDLQVKNDRLFDRIFRNGSLGLGEAYMDGWWDCKQLDEFFYRVLRAKLDKKIKWNWPLLWRVAVSKIFNQQSRHRGMMVAKKHYDLTPVLFESFLDPYNQYTCGYFEDTKDLNDAQKKKLDLICRKLQLTSKDRILDIGCGWGGFAKYASGHYGCHVTGITISDEQIKYAREYTRGLPVEIRKQDYRDINEKFDHIVSIGMIEHVGYKNYRTYMRVVSQCLKDNGLFLLHTIGNNESATTTDPWIAKYIFQNGHLPSIKQIGAAIENLFIMEDWHNFGADYDKTLMAWYNNFEKNWSILKSNFSERFYRMWKYYLLSCAGSFRARKIQLWQIVLSKKGAEGGYKSIR